VNWRKGIFFLAAFVYFQTISNHMGDKNSADRMQIHIWELSYVNMKVATIVGKSKL
jgi:hypothetical protein